MEKEYLLTIDKILYNLMKANGLKGNLMVLEYANGKMDQYTKVSTIMVRNMVQVN
jgi:CobQ-like glutamine amidotransferase family enzyme